MSAIYHLKNLITTFTGKLFTPSKKNHRHIYHHRDDTTITNTPKKEGVIRILSEKKHHQPSQELSDYTIF